MIGRLEDWAMQKAPNGGAYLVGMMYTGELGEEGVMVETPRLIAKRGEIIITEDGAEFELGQPLLAYAKQFPGCRERLLERLAEEGSVEVEAVVSAWKNSAFQVEVGDYHLYVLKEVGKQKITLLSREAVDPERIKEITASLPDDPKDLVMSEELTVEGILLGLSEVPFGAGTHLLLKNSYPVDYKAPGPNPPYKPGGNGAGQ